MTTKPQISSDYLTLFKGATWAIGCLLAALFGSIFIPLDGSWHGMTYRLVLPVLAVIAASIALRANTSSVRAEIAEGMDSPRLMVLVWGGIVLMASIFAGGMLMLGLLLFRYLWS